MNNPTLIIAKGLTPVPNVVMRANEFLSEFKPFEVTNDGSLLLYFDKRNGAYYLLAHLESKMLAIKSDLDAVLDPVESDEYKLNRDIYIDAYAYRFMAADALKGRSFEDIVVEYDKSYRGEKPLKVFGGQHRVTAISEAFKKGVSAVHGVRVYLNLTVDQRYDVAIANNTSIAVSNDLLDRMQEETLGSQLREWCQEVGLLNKGQNFADRRNPDGTPTVRIARTLIVNYYSGKRADKDAFHMPAVTSSGTGIDNAYMTVRDELNWDDKAVQEMGKQFAKLHWTQRDKVLKRTTDKHMEFANKAMHPVVAASWSYAAGLFQREASALNRHYSLPNIGGDREDPLNATALSKAKLPGIDKDSYRGLGARINDEELGRMLAVFLLQATKATKPGINLKLANAAIKSFQAVKLTFEASKAMKGI